METKIEYEISTDLDLNSSRNYTLFVHELERIAFGRENPDFQHGMSSAEYDRFVNDMWIGIILTMLMVLIVFSLCIWYMYHKFQQWKRHYDARLRMRNNTTGGINADAECLPNYTLVSGLPTYDDALEQLRLHSTNHILINHQTIMKMFGSIKDKPKKQKAEVPVPTYEDSIRPQLENPLRSADSPANLSTNQSSLLSNTNTSNNRFKCTIVLPSTNALEQNHQTDVARSSGECPVFISNSLGTLNIGKEIQKSRPHIIWSPHAHRSTSLCIDFDNASVPDLENASVHSEGHYKRRRRHRHHYHSEHRGSLY